MVFVYLRMHRNCTEQNNKQTAASQAKKKSGHLALHDQNRQFRSIWPTNNCEENKTKSRAIFLAFFHSLVLALFKSQFKFCGRENRIFFFAPPAGEYHAKNERISIHTDTERAAEHLSVNLFMNMRELGASQHIKFQIQH